MEIYEEVRTCELPYYYIIQLPEYFKFLFLEVYM